MKKTARQIIINEYPDIDQLLKDAHVAASKTLFLDNNGRTDEAKMMWKLHEELFEQYMFAEKLVVTDRKDLIE